MAQLSNGSGSTSPWHCDLLRAIKQGDEGKVKGLVLGDDGERAKQTYKTTLRQGLQAAAGLGKTSIVQWLLDNGAEVEAVENEVSALFRAVEWGHCPIVQKLIDKGADIEVKDRFQRTVLFHAVSKAHVQVVKALFQARADVSVKDIELRTVLLHVAAQKQDSKIDKQYGCFPRESQEPNHLEGQTIVELLLEKDIDLEAKDKLGRTVLHWAAATGKEKLLASLICERACKRANIDARNRRSKTALHLAAENHHPEIARILLEQGADCNARSDGAWAPLHIAAEKGYLDIIKLLSHHGANLNAETTNGMTPLHWAATNGNVEVVKELLSQPRIKRHPKDSPGYTPLMRAAQHKHTVIAHLLSSSDDGRDLSTIARQACTEYKATIVDFFPQRTDRKKFAVFNKPTIFELLYGIEPKGDGERKPLWKAAIESTKAKPAFRWIHLPANNMAWAETLITKYFKERGFVDDGFNALAKSMSDQHRGKTDHSQFMRPSCQRLPSSPRIPQSKRIPDGPREGKDTNGDRRSKAIDKASRDQLNELQRVKSADKEIDGDHIPKSPTRAAKEPKKKSEGLSLSTTPPSPTRTRSSIDHFLDRVPTRTDGKERPQGPALLSNDSTLVEPGHGITRSSTNKSNVETSMDSANITLFMPYLHYETDKSRLQMRETINKAFAKRRAVKESQAAAAAAFTKEEMLDKKILLNEASLHPQRTFNQFYYPAIGSDTSSQTGTSGSKTDLSKDQELHKHRKISVTDDPKKPHVLKKAEDPKTTAEPPLSKDQKLIHAYLLNAPPLHPRRTLDQFYYSAFDTEARDQDQVVYRYCDRHKMELKVFMVDQLWLWILGKDLIITSFPRRWNQPKNDPFDVLDGIIEDMYQPRVGSVYDLASRITGRCSGMFYQDWQDDDYHFLDMFEHSIGDLESKEPKLASDFDKSAKEAKEWFDSQSRIEKYPKFDDYFMNIGGEMALLTEIKDVNNELSMISAVLAHQTFCLTNLSKAIQEEPELSSDKKDELKIVFEEQGMIIDGYVANIERMDKEVNDLEKSVNPLLDLKQKYAGVFEARYARLQATSAVRQGHTIMVFTIVTIIFLPMSFVAALFAINVQEFPRSPTGYLHLGYVSKYIFGIGLAISVPLIFGALTIDNLSRFFNRLTAPDPTGSPDSATERILKTRKWRPWLWHSKLPEKRPPECDSEYKFPTRTPTVLSTTATKDTRHEVPAPTTLEKTPESHSSPLFDQGNFFARSRSERGKRRFSLVPPTLRAGEDPERGEA